MGMQRNRNTEADEGRQSRMAEVEDLKRLVVSVTNTMLDSCTAKVLALDNTLSRLSLLSCSNLSYRFLNLISSLSGAPKSVILPVLVVHSQKHPLIHLGTELYAKTCLYTTFNPCATQ